VLYRDEVPHNFPKPHTDVLEQFIDYRVPVDKCAGVGSTCAAQGIPEISGVDAKAHGRA
jgi:hypothetical protein